MIQNTEKFCFGIDSTFLAWFADVKENEKVLDLCTGSGIVMLLMDARYQKGDYTGLEIQDDVAETANRSVHLNCAESHMRVLTGNVKEAADMFGRASFDVVTVNPPYMAKGNGLINPDYSLAVSRHEILCTLEDVIEESSAVLKEKGRFYMVHRPARLPEILSLAKKYGMTVTAVQMIHPTKESEATMVLVKAEKGTHKILHTLPPVIIYESKGVYTEQVKKIYTE